MRNLIVLVSLGVILVGLVALVAAIPPLLTQVQALADFQSGLSLVIASLTPGGAIILLGSITYLLCSIDMRLQELVDRPPPKAAAPAPAPAKPASLDHDLF